MKCVLVLALGLMLPAPVIGAGLLLVPDTAAPATGNTVTIDVNIDEAVVGCFSFSVEYDPAVLEYLGASEGPLFSGAPELTFFSDDVDDEGRPQPNDCLLGFGTSVAGPGTIAQLSFSVLGEAGTAVTLRDVVLRDVDRLAIAGVADASTYLNTSTTSSPRGLTAGTLVAAPNPSSSTLSLVLSGLPSERRGRASIFDTAGRLVREIEWPASQQRINWDGRDLHGRLVANGIYLARFESGARTATTRIVRVR
jgi:hypothetical protein